jgi:hypothetical protein
MNLLKQKLGIGRAIYEIGSGKTVTLHYNEDATEDDVIPDPPGKLSDYGYMVSCEKNNYYPSIQGELRITDDTLSASVEVKESGESMAKWYAETLIGKIEEQMKEKAKA